MIRLLNMVNILEVKGQNNIAIMFNIIGYLQSKIQELEDIEKEELKKNNKEV